MVRRALIAQQGCMGEWRVDRELFRVREYCGQRPLRLCIFQCAVRHGRQVRGREMDATICAIRSGRDGRRIGRPHAGGGAVIRNESWTVFKRAFQNLRVRPCISQSAKAGNVRSLLRGQQSLRHAKIDHVPHFRQALQSRRAWVGCLTFMLRGRDIAVAKARIIMGRPDKTVEIHFNRHD